MLSSLHTGNNNIDNNYYGNCENQFRFSPPHEVQLISNNYIPVYPFPVMNDPIEHATGLEKKELLAKLAGNDDPYHMSAIKRGPSTKENPTMVPSAFEARIMGCICK